ncbi:adenylyltransferase/cytidyltransferase family protein [bacterium]|nr:adenylyltransferase/cytidyltransferase family protein [bacterium]
MSNEHRRFLFSSNEAPETRIVRDYDDLVEIISHCRGLGQKIVLTMGTFDLFHVGHAKYLAEASRHGDILIVGVDSDDKVKRRKGPSRPIVPEGERMEILCHQRAVDIVTIKPYTSEKWELIKLIHPDVLIATAETYTADELELLREEFCGEIVVLTPMAETSTTAKIRLMWLEFHDKLGQALNQAVPAFITDVLKRMENRDD